MDRRTVYAGQIPLETDILFAGQAGMTALAKFCAAVLGTSGTIVNGFTCTPTTPASLNILVTAGEIYQVENLEQSTWSSLPSDTHSILKQGLLMDPATFGIVPPGTVGWSQSFLVEAQYQDIDTGSVVLPYFNASNPAVPFSGPGNAGTAQNTIRRGLAALQVKAGTAAITGTQTVPTPDAGWTGLFVVTVANGAATITSGNITQYAGAPFMLTTLPNVPANVQGGFWQYGEDAGTPNNVVVTLSPVPTQYIKGMRLNIKMANAPTGPSVINCNGLGNKSIVVVAAALAGQEWSANQIVGLVYDGVNFQLQNFAQTPGAPIYLTTNKTWYVNAGTGSDSNDGQAATVGGGHGPWATLQHAMVVLSGYNLNGFNMTVNVAAGTYTGGLDLLLVGGSGTVSWVGVPATPASCLISTTNRGAVRGTDCGKVHVLDGFRYQCTNGGAMIDSGDGVVVQGQSVVSLMNSEFGPCVGAHIDAIGGGKIRKGGPIWRISGGGVAHEQASTNGVIDSISISPANLSLNVTTAVTFSTAFINANILSSISTIYASSTGGGSVTGKKFESDTNAVISSFGNGINYFPGTVAGTTSTGGQYV